MSSNPNARRAIGKQVPTPRRATKANPAVSPAKAVVPKPPDADGAATKVGKTTAATAPVVADAAKAAKTAKVAKAASPAKPGKVKGA